MTAVPDYLFNDVRRFAVPPGRPYGSERVERRPPRLLLRPLVRRWVDRRARWLAADGDAAELPADLPAYLAAGDGVRVALSSRRA